MKNSIKYQYAVTHKIDFKKLEDNINQVKILCHPIRYAIIIMLSTHEKMTVTQIYQELSVDQAAASNHLKLMKDCHVLEAQRSGKNIYYSINSKSLNKIARVLRVGVIDVESFPKAFCAV
ncbi:MAG TPA: metalloregulator ArsR/SmtB family transcription factor [Bacteroidales bacterium]|nr:metalloregulator ArsR/SmtB family transcription factor [Bacteroidales bacterium]